MRLIGLLRSARQRMNSQMPIAVQAAVAQETPIPKIIRRGGPLRRCWLSSPELNAGFENGDVYGPEAVGVVLGRATRVKDGSTGSRQVSPWPAASRSGV